MAHPATRADPPPVVVVGGGVAGLTTAVRLREAGHAVRVLSAHRLDETTSTVAGATWFPYKVDPPDRVNRWSAASKPVFDALAADGQAGVVIRRCVQYWRQPVEQQPWWASAIPDFAPLPAADLPPGFAAGYAFHQPVIDMSTYLPYLRRRLERAGGSIAIARVASLTDAAAGGEVVVNCSGLGARELAADPRVRPVRGQWVRVSNPGIDEVVADFGRPDGDTYIIPHRASCILGGTADDGAWDTTVDSEVSARIRSRCAELDPRLATATTLEQRVGLRPVRRGGVRLDMARLPNGATCVHNYGHGGGGVTLSWGCADEVLTMVRSLQEPRPERDTTG